MVRLHRGLLVALVFICALAASVGGVTAQANTLRQGVSLQTSHIGPSTEGEPDVGGAKDPPKTPQSSYDPNQSRSRWTASWAQQIRWMRMTSGIWMARNLGVIFRF
jgi:hypothetical protein